LLLKLEANFYGTRLPLHRQDVFNYQSHARQMLISSNQSGLSTAVGRHELAQHSAWRPRNSSSSEWAKAFEETGPLQNLHHSAEMMGFNISEMKPSVELASILGWRTKGFQRPRTTTARCRGNQITKSSPVLVVFPRADDVT
jgi:hypothetical protein